ncbi:hypothetical protein AWB68_05928 [Caballeronia choica]|uniref:Uncharacterized protein n=1 Tax=Caballeronia choica TaxID=326476 RepID=A0A158KJ29_9BURK|nr:hypothetical protein AWB68_05928 [Caballeronia choica]
MRRITITSTSAPSTAMTSAAAIIDSQKPAAVAPKRLVRLYATYTPSI